MKLVYARQAVGDLVRLRAFIAEHGPDAAARVAATLIGRVEQLRHFPHLGVAVEQAPPPAEIRDMVFGNDVVRYSVHQDAIAILRIWHYCEDRHATST